MTKKYKRKSITGLKKKRSGFKSSTKTYKKLSAAIKRKRAKKKPAKKKGLLGKLFGKFRGKK